MLTMTMMTITSKAVVVVCVRSGITCPPSFIGKRSYIPPLPPRATAASRPIACPSSIIVITIIIIIIIIDHNATVDGGPYAPTIWTIDGIRSMDPKWARNECNSNGSTKPNECPPENTIPTGPPPR
jgi:hypothetical protein